MLSIYKGKDKVAAISLTDLIETITKGKGRFVAHYDTAFKGDCPYDAT